MNTDNSTNSKIFFAKKLTNRRFLTSGKVALGVLLLLGIGFGLRLPHLMAKDERPETQAPRRLPVETLRVKALSAYEADRAYTGRITARRSSDLGFERRGKLLRLDVDDGAQVEAGTPLATLDTQELLTTQRSLQAQRNQAAAKLAELRAGPRSETIAAAQAEVRERQAELKLAQQRRTRRGRLWKKGVISREEYDAAIAELGTWRARLDASQRRLDELQAGTRHEQVQAQDALVAQFDARLAAVAIDLNKSILKAPFAGTVAARLADEGTVITAGQPILRLVETAHLEVRVGVPPRVASALSLGREYQVQVDSQRHSVRLTALLPELDAATRTVTAVLMLRNAPNTTAVPGQVARLNLTERIGSAGFWLPTTALTKGERGLWSCWVLVKNSDHASAGFRIERRAVEILQTENNRVFVRGLLQSGDQVVKSGAHRVVAGQRVTPITSVQPRTSIQ